MAPGGECVDVCGVAAPPAGECFDVPTRYVYVGPDLAPGEMRLDQYQVMDDDAEFWLCQVDGHCGTGGGEGRLRLRDHRGYEFSNRRVPGTRGAMPMTIQPARRIPAGAKIGIEIENPGVPALAVATVLIFNGFKRYYRKAEV